MDQREIKIEGTSVSTLLTDFLAKNGIEYQVQDGEFKPVQDYLSKIGYRLTFTVAAHKVTGKNVVISHLYKLQEVDHIIIPQADNNETE